IGRLLLKNSAVILAGGLSKRFGRDKSLIELAGKPLILHVLDRAFEIVVDETVVVVSSEIQKNAFASLLGRRANVIVDKYKAQSPLVGALTGFETVHGEYSLLLSCDTPFVSSQIAQFLLDLCVNRGAVIPRWPNGYIEPLQAAYHTRSALTAAKTVLEEGKLDLRSMIARLNGVRYVSTMVLRQMDPQLLTFFNINTLEDLRRAESLLK
ncbi:MAG: molybdenum cofactor guanylyltransferase, partial [Candidatus Bathyarchaeia archaeon]